MNRFPIEFQLLLLCSSYFSDKEKFCELKENHNIDWTSFLSLLHRHRVLPMVCHNMYRWGIELPIKNDLKIASLEHSKKSLQQVAVLLEINKLFQDNGVECVHFKGPSLSYYLYQDASLRHYRDIDILIEKKNIMPAYELLFKNGFSTSTPLFKKDYLNKRYQTWTKDYLFKKHNCDIELHWSLSNLLNTNLNELFFSNKNLISFYNQSIKILDHHYYLSYLILHGYRSGWARLHWLIDIIDFIKTHPINWQTVKTVIESTCHGQAVNEIIELLFLLFSYEKPISDPASKKLIRNTLKIIQTPIKTGVLTKYDLRLHYRYFFLLAHGFKNKCHYLKTNFGTSAPDWYMLPLPKPLFFLYYPLRPILRIIRKIRKI